MLPEASFNLKDKRVDKTLRLNGIKYTDIFYSPIGDWLILCVFILAGVCIISTTPYGFFVVPYLGISYLLNAHYNNSFAFNEDSLIVVNPNFPFRRMTIINLNEITMVTIDEENKKWTWAFIVLGENYLEVETKGCSRKFNCSGLQLDGFDENWTQKTIEDLDSKLKEKGILTDFRLTY